METAIALASKLTIPALREGVPISIGSFSIRLTIEDRQVAQEFCALYEGFPTGRSSSISDFRIELKSSRALESGFSLRLRAYIDHLSPFKPVIPERGVPLLESAMNWCLGRFVTRYLIIHAAVLEHQGLGLLLPGPPGSGKSTLTAALVGKGWRLLSDEAAMIDFESGLLRPHPRPISLKNESIDLIAARFPSLASAKRYEGTPKGTVAYLKAPAEAVRKAMIPAIPSLIMFPKYQGGGSLRIEEIDKADAFMLMQKQSPNYRVLLEKGFLSLAKLMEACGHLSLTFSDLDEAIEIIETLWGEHAKGTNVT